MNTSDRISLNRLRRGSVFILVLIGLMGVILLGIGTWFTSAEAAYRNLMSR